MYQLFVQAVVAHAALLIQLNDINRQIAARYQVQELVLTHIRPKSAALLQAMVADVRRYYQGPVSLGADLLVIEL